MDILINRYADGVFWPGASASPQVASYRNWVFGVTGATMGGWGITMLWVVGGPFRKRERWAWLAMTLPLCCWYVTDTLASLVHGVVSNAVLNTGLLVLFALPPAGTASAFPLRRS